MAARSLVFVEGDSDRVAVATLAERLGRDLAAEGVEVVVLAGATNFAKRLAEATSEDEALRIAGLYDDAEQRYFAHGLVRAGFGPVPDRDQLAVLGFFACVADLEDELIRAVGEKGMLDVIEAQGELASFALLQRQPAQRDWSRRRQLRRFLSARSGNKSRYAALLSRELELTRIPLPLEQLLERC